MEHNCTQENRIQQTEILTRSLVEDVGQIKDVLLPSEYHPDNGLINRFARIEKQLDELQKDILKMKTWVLSAIGIIGGIITAVEVISKFI